MNNKERTQPFGCVLSLGKGERWKHGRAEIIPAIQRQFVAASVPDWALSAFKQELVCD